MNFFAGHLRKNFLVAAPMAGVSSAPFRLLLRDFFDGLVYTEMVSAEGVSRNNPSSMEYLDIMGNSRPVVAQLFGGNPKAYPPALHIAEEYSNPDAFDINMGCPVKKVLKTGGGASLLTNLELLKQVVRTVRKGTQKPFSIKIRMGWDEKTPVYKEILDIAQSEGSDALILHARPRSQMFGGAVHYHALAELAAIATIPVIGNGDISDPASLQKMKDTGVSGAMIGRAMMRAPWVFAALKQGVTPDGYLSGAGLYHLLIKLYRLMLIHAGSNPHKQLHYLNVIKKYSVWFSKRLPEAATFRGMVYQNNDETYFLNLLEKFYVHHI